MAILSQFCFASSLPFHFFEIFLLFHLLQLLLQTGVFSCFRSLLSAEIFLERHLELDFSARCLLSLTLPRPAFQSTSPRCPPHVYPARTHTGFSVESPVHFIFFQFTSLFPASYLCTWLVPEFMRNANVHLQCIGIQCRVGQWVRKLKLLHCDAVTDDLSDQQDEQR